LNPGGLTSQGFSRAEPNVAGGGDRDRVVVIGQGYVGMHLAVRAVDVGYEVVGFDVDIPKLETLAAGMSPIRDVSNEQLRAALATGRYRLASEPAAVAGFDVAVIAVPTPLNDGNPDLTSVQESAKMLAEYLRPGALVVLESTTYPGTTEEIVAPILEAGSALVPGRDFYLGYSPERLDPGNTTWSLRNTPKLVSGIDADSLRAVKAFYDALVDETIATKGTREAELAKLLENTFRHVNIALVNELAMCAKELEIDIWDAIDAAATKPFGFMKFTPGPGVGGHCLPVDPLYLSWKFYRHSGRSLRLVEIANDVNEAMPEYVVRRVEAGLNSRDTSIKGSRVLLLGLAYKQGIADSRESPTFRIAELLIEKGAVVAVADPHAPINATPPGTTRVPGDRSDMNAANAVALVVHHPEFDLETLAGLNSYVFDCRGATSPGSAERL
jgi:UDP-N-acetyl-D-glucosamine dehydrogenase